MAPNVWGMWRASARARQAAQADADGPSWCHRGNSVLRDSFLQQLLRW